MDDDKTRKLTQAEVKSVAAEARDAEMRDLAEDFCKKFMELSRSDLSIKSVTKEEIIIVRNAIKVINKIEGRIR